MPRRDRSLFLLVLCISLFAVGSFALAAIGSEVRRSRYTPLVSVHALLLTAWLVLLCVQASLADWGRLATHRKLGRASGMLVALFVPLSAVVAVQFHGEFDRTATLVADLGLLVTFVPLYLFAIWFARKGRIDVHKRLMLVGTIALISPAFGRLTDVLSLPRPAAVPMYLAVLILAPLAYDVASQRRPHRASLASVGFSLAIFFAIVAVAVSTGEL